MQGVGFTASKPFTDWLYDRGRAIAFTSCDAGSLVVLHVATPGKMEASFFPAPVAMGLAYHDRSLYLTDRFGVWRFDLGDATPAGRPATLRAVARYFVGDVDLHEISIGTGDTMWSTATVWNAVTVVTPGGWLERRWRPAFVSADIAEDRCHINGLALEGGEPAYVTCVSRSDVIDGWRDRRRDGGVVLDVRTSEPVATGLSMPHSPRLVDGTLWVANSGAGEVGRVDRETKTFAPLCFVPGFARGLVFDGDEFLVGLSKARGATVFGDVPLDARLESAGATARCGIHLCERSTGRTIGWLRLEGPIGEVFDLALVPARGRVVLDDNGAASRPSTGSASS